MLRPRGLRHHPSSSSSIPSPVEPSRLQPGYWLFSIVTYPWPPWWGMGFSLVAACGPLTAMLLLVQSTGPRAPGFGGRGTKARELAHGLQSRGSADAAHRLGCSTARGVFLDQGSNPCLLRWQVFFTTEPPGKTLGAAFLLWISASSLCDL